MDNSTITLNLLNPHFICSIIYPNSINTFQEETFMQLLYKAGGTLSKDFIGQISYTVCLDRKYEELDIEFSYIKTGYCDLVLS